MAQDIDPVGTGFVASLARPGGNITGLASLTPEISGKQLELLKEIVPRLSRVAVLWASSNPANAQLLREMESSAGTLGLKIQAEIYRVQKTFRLRSETSSKARADALLVLQNGVVTLSAKGACRPCDKEPASGDVPQGAICRRRRAYQLRCELCGYGPARR